MDQNNSNQDNGAQYAPSPQSTKGKNTVMAVIAYILFFIPLLTNSKNDPFVKYHVKQGLVLSIANVIAMVLSWVPIVEMFVWIVNIALFVLFILGIINAIKGEEKELPIIGQYAKNFKF